MAAYCFWENDGSLTLVDGLSRWNVPKENLGHLRHVLANGPPPRGAESDENKVAGEPKAKVAGRKPEPHEGRA